MFKTYYISLDHGKTFKRLTTDKTHFLYQMWTNLTKELYPLGELSVRHDVLGINIREPKDMREILTVFIDAETTLDKLWETINHMWDEIEVRC